MSRRIPAAGSGRTSGALWLYGFHAVKAALANPLRRKHRCVLTEQAADYTGKQPLSQIEIEIAPADRLSRLLPQGAVHQGVALSCEPLSPPGLADVIDLPGRKIVLILDQIADPHNVGAILR